ncbi:MAG: class I SAM-dependent RNA methyltransferase [Pseudomonadota bacterium]
MKGPFPLFLVCPPGLETHLAAEAAAIGLEGAAPAPGGVTARGDWPDIWRANLMLRGAVRINVEIGAFRAPHLAQLDKRARRVPWAELLHPGTPISVEAQCKRSRIYHAGAAAERVERAICEGAGAKAGGEDAIRFRVRIEDDLCTLSLDSSGEPLYRRGHKQAVGKAPLRETLAALFLKAAGFTGAEAVVDPMCGSGTLVIEAADMASGALPGRDRRFAFEGLRTNDASKLSTLRAAPAAAPKGPARFFGSDRDAGAIRMSTENAARAGLETLCSFDCHAVSDLVPPAGVEPGLVITNPPYGARIGDTKSMSPLYAAFGRVLKEHFTGWRAAIITSEASLARATGLPFESPGPPVPHGPLRIRLWQTPPLS